MRLTTFSDYALRVLLYAANAGDRLITIEETAKVYRVSRAHLMKVVNMLTRAGYLKAVRGRSGGLLLARPPEEIRLGDVIRLAEPDFALVECFATGNECILTPRCGLPRDTACYFEAVGLGRPPTRSNSHHQASGVQGSPLEAMTRRAERSYFFQGSLPCAMKVRAVVGAIPR